MRYACHNCGFYLNQFGHIAPPPNSCTRCWFHYFNQNPAKVNAAHYAIDTLGRESAVKTKGEKYIKMFERFLQESSRIENDSRRSSQRPERKN